VKKVKFYVKEFKILYLSFLSEYSHISEKKLKKKGKERDVNIQKTKENFQKTEL